MCWQCQAQRELLAVLIDSDGEYTAEECEAIITET